MRERAFYQRLLWAYPRAYRSQRGIEMLTTLLEMAEAAPGRLSRGQALHVVLCGLRQRFRLPAGRPLAWVGALLAAVVLGAFGAAGGTWLGWQTAASVPSDPELSALNAAMTGMPAPASVSRQVSAMKGPDKVVRTDGTGDYSAERVRLALASAGWRITLFQQHDGETLGSFDKDAYVATKFVYYAATKGGLKLAGRGTVISGSADHGRAGQANYRTEVWPREPAAVRSLTVVGLIAGALAGWLTAVALTFRVRGRGPLRRWVATAWSTVALAATAVPAFAHYQGAYQVMTYAHGSPIPYLVNNPSAEIPVGRWTTLGLFAIAAALVAAWPRRAPDALAVQPTRADETTC